ncbi:hypothetical protein J4211_02725 [Candidatus Woesearchaeota archaeon]|nr:hypothetical protein [Candidatus Woesearchaeota archaeon]
MRKSVIVLFVVLLSCTQFNTGTEQKQPTTGYRTGSQGLLITFLPNLPPPRVFDRDPFNVVLQVENLGTGRVGNGLDRLYISGFDHNLITGIGTDGIPLPLLEGRTQYINRGGLDTLSYRGTIRSLTEKRIDKYQPLILATACYHYETIANAQVCVDPDPYAPTSTARVCTPTAVGTGSQGAPVAVTNVQVDAAPGWTRFTINVQNVGGGSVFRNGNHYLAKCSPYNPGLAFDELDFVQVADVMISDTSIKSSCKPIDSSGHLRLQNGAGQIFCELNAPQGQTPYLTPLNIVLKYGYRQTIAKPVEIYPLS